MRSSTKATSLSVCSFIVRVRNEDKIGDTGLGMMISRSLGAMLYSTSAYASGMNYPAEHTISPFELQITVSKVSALIIRLSFQLNHMHSLV